MSLVLSESDPKVTALLIFSAHIWAGLKFRVQNNSTFNTCNEKLHLSQSPEHKNNINIAVVD